MDNDDMKFGGVARMGVGYATYAIERLLEMTGQPLRLVSGVLHEECAALRLPPRA